VIVQERVAHRADLPVRHLALVHVRGVAGGDRHVVAARDLQHLDRVFECAQDQRRAAERVLRIGEGHHEFHDHDARLGAEPDRGVSIRSPLIVVSHLVSPR
jgi:hypothetical protein